MTSTDLAHLLTWTGWVFAVSCALGGWFWFIGQIAIYVSYRRRT